MKNTLFDSKLFFGRFGSYLLHVPSLLNWAASKGHHLPETNPPIDSYKFVQVEVLLQEIMRDILSITPEDGIRAVQINPELNGEKFARQNYLSRFLLATDSRAIQSNLIADAIKTGELKLLDFGRKTPITDEQLDAISSSFSQVHQPSAGSDGLMDWLSRLPHTNTDAIETLQTESKVDDGETNASDTSQDCDSRIYSNVKYWATTDSLIKAFEPYGLTKEKIRNGSTNYIKGARKLQGQGGKGRALQPMFCPYEIMLGLAHKARPRNLSEKRGWEILESKFPATYSKFQDQDPRKYTD